MMKIFIFVFGLLLFFSVSSDIKAQNMMPELDVQYKGSPEIKNISRMLFLGNIDENEDAYNTQHNQYYNLIIALTSYKTSALLRPEIIAESYID